MIPTVPENIVVHLGAPDGNGENVTVSFPNYIKNVASSEIYPTWPEEAIKANVLAQSSVALNRVFTGFYRNQGYPFDITSSPAYDQTFVYQRDIYDNISEIVDEMFNSYIRRRGSIEPLFAQFCDGREVVCNGLQQWDSVRLAENGLDYIEITKYFYGDDIEVVTDAPVANKTLSAPLYPLSEGDTGRDVQLIQIRLNRIARNYPGIPKIENADGFFGESTKNAVKKFQEVFGLGADGIVGKATWNRIEFIYNSVKKLYSINSEGLRLEDVQTDYPGVLALGEESTGVAVLQYYLAYISLFIPTVLSPTVDGIYGISTENAVKSFQKTYGLTIDGIVGEVTWNTIESIYLGIVESYPIEYREGLIIPFPGRILRIGVEGNDVKALQEYLNYISDYYPEIPKVTVDGVFGPSTAAAVAAFSSRFDLQGDPQRVSAIKWKSIIDVYDDLYEGNLVNDDQFPGFGIP